MRILMLTSSSGGGHVRAGSNLKMAFAQVAPDVQVDIADSYDFVHPFKKWQYTRAWEFVTHYLPVLYRPLRNAVVENAWAVRVARRGFRPAARKLGAWLQQREVAGEKIDAVLATHAHGAGVCALLKQQPAWRHLYLAQVYTDFQFHAFYVTPGVDHYFAPAASIADHVRTAAPGALVTTSGMPIHPAFTTDVPRSDARTTFGIANDGRPVVLVSRGSFGWGYRLTLEIVAALMHAGLALHVVAHAGTNKPLAARFTELFKQTETSKATGHVLGWLDNFPTLLAATDLYIGKPGGMQVAECLARGVPMAVFDPIPGQEDANIQFIEEQAVGTRLTSAQQALAWVRQLTSEPAVKEKMQTTLRRVGKPQGARTIATTVLADLVKRSST